VHVTSIQTTIIPGNKTRRTYSVMKAILGQIGQPFTITRNNKTEVVYGWSETKYVSLQVPKDNPVKHRLASLVYTPDADLFPDRYLADTVTLIAGLEIKLFHRTLQLAASLVRWKLINSLAPATNIARRIASLFEHIGSDTGGMCVTVVGKNTLGHQIERRWELGVGDGMGPEIPTIPVSVLLNKLNSNELDAGARPAIGEFSLPDLQDSFQAINAETHILERRVTGVFQKVLGDQFDVLPQVIKQLHTTYGLKQFEGLVDSKGPSGISGRLCAALFRFPQRAKQQPITVCIEADENQECWRRIFVDRTMKSHLSVDSEGFLQERFGPITLQIDLVVKDSQLHYPARKALLFGTIPLPCALMPIRIAHESDGESGRFYFDIELKLFTGVRLAHYRGWLQVTSD